MKNLFLITGVLLCSAALAGCVKKPHVDEPDEPKETKISLTAGIETRTDFTDPANPIWSEGDAIGVHIINNSLGLVVGQNIRLNGTFTDEYRKATFTGTAPGLRTGEYTFVGYYPHGEAGAYTTEPTRAEIEIPAVQRPTATSFDARADIMAMKSITHNHTINTPVSYDGLMFKRMLGMVKIVLNSDRLNGEAVKSLTFTTDNAELKLAGKARFDLIEGEFVEFYEGETTSVTAEPAGNIFANGTDALMLCIPAVTIAPGTTMTITGETENYTFEKTKQLDAPVELVPGNWHTMNVTLTREDVTSKNGDGLDYDETLDNQWERSNVDGKVTIGKAEFSLKKLPGSPDKYDFVFYDQVIKDNFIHITLPASKIGSELVFERVENPDNWSLEFIHNGDLYYGSGTSMNTAASNIAEGKTTITKDGTNITYKMAVKFTDGVVLKAKFVGTATDLDYIEVGEDVIPGANQYAYNGKLYDIEAPFYSPQREGTDGVGIIYLPALTGFDTRAQFNLPLTVIDNATGQETLDLMYILGQDSGELVVFTNGERSQISPGSASNMVSGTMNLAVNKEARTMTVTADVLYKNDIHLRINYSGPIAGVYGTTTAPSSIDELVGTWDVNEVITKAYGGANYFTNNHVITISKIDDTTIEISNFTNGATLFEGGNGNGGDVVRANVNSVMTMKIGKDVVLDPAWSSDGSSTYVVPMTSWNISVAKNAEFKDQTFRKTADGTIIMVMWNSITGFDIGHPMLTYAVGDWTGTSLKKTWFYACNTIWTKRVVVSEYGDPGSAGRPGRNTGSTNW